MAGALRSGLIALAVGGAIAAGLPAGAPAASAATECQVDDSAIGTRMNGDVVDSSGAPVNGADVRAYSLDPSVPSRFGRTLGGHFILWDLDPNASYYVAVTPPPELGSAESWAPGGVGSQALAVPVTDLQPCVVNGLEGGDIVVGDDLRSIESLTPPTITGDPQVNQFLIAHDGTWSEPGVLRVIRWYVAGRMIGSETGYEYFPLERDLGKTVTVTITATKRGFRPTRVESAATTVVKPGTILVAEEPAVMGALSVGSVLRADDGAWRTARGRLSGVGVRHTWIRDGVPVGTGSSYRVTAKDVGATFRLKVVATRAAHRAKTVTTRQTAAVRKVRSRTTLSVRRVGEGRATAKVTVKATGLTHPGGTVTIKDGGSVVAKVKVGRNGHATARLGKLSAGKHRLTAVYSGSSKARTSRATTRVTIRR